MPDNWLIETNQTARERSGIFIRNQKIRDLLESISSMGYIGVKCKT
jgi:hypothetical protein